MISLFFTLETTVGRAIGRFSRPRVGEAAVRNANTRMWFTLNMVGAHTWKLAGTLRTLGQILDARSPGARSDSRLRNDFSELEGKPSAAGIVDTRRSQVLIARSVAAAVGLVRAGVTPGGRLTGRGWLDYGEILRGATACPYPGRMDLERVLETRP